MDTIIELTEREGFTEMASLFDLIDSDHVVIICVDCLHEHHGNIHGFCYCGCTYPGLKVVG